MKDSAKVITMAGVKGGIGKTALTDALCSYILHTNPTAKVLLIDMNSQMDLTNGFDLSAQQLKTSNIFRAFEHDTKSPQSPFPNDFKPAKVNSRLDIFTASKNLIYTNAITRTTPATAPYILSHVFSALKLQSKYDYILIDTHNDRQIPVQNALVVSDVVLSPVTPSKYGINSIADTLGMFNDLRGKLLSPVTQKSFINAKLYFVGNMIEFTTSTSHKFLSAIKHDPHFIGFLHRRTIFNKANMNDTNIYDLAEKEAKHHKPNDLNKIKKEITPQLHNIMQVINK